MAYNDETYGNALEQALAKMVTRHCVGEMWVGFSAAEKPAGVLLRDASLQSRGLYAGLWQWASDKGLVLTDAEWQAEYAANGVCHKYSDGDGSTTFRMPSAPLYIKGAENAGQAGAYVAEGLPNISGEVFNFIGDNASWGPHTNSAYGNAFIAGKNANVGGALFYTTQSARESGANSDGFILDASRCSPVYGNSSHVTPATSKLLFGVWAVSTAGVAVPDANAEEILGQVELVTNELAAAKSELAAADDLKADLNLSNLSTAGKEVAAKASMPGGRYVDLTLGADGTTYTAPADGWFAIVCLGNQVRMASRIANGSGAYTANFASFCSVPVGSGDTMTMQYSSCDLSNSWAWFRFIYAEGAE